HFSTLKGLRFATKLDTGPINLKHDPSLAIGTTIRIRVSREVYVQFAPQNLCDKWDWYCLQKPSVLRRLGKERTILRQRLNVPDQNEVLPPIWFSVPAQGFAKVHVSNPLSTRNPWLFCNGIKIVHGNFTFIDTCGRNLFRLTTPSMSIFDPDALLPLTLQRDKLDAGLPFREEVNALLAKTLLADMLYLAPEDRYDYGKMDSLIPRLTCDDSNREYVVRRPWLHTREGITLAEVWCAFMARLQSFLVLVDAPDRETKFSTVISPDAYDTVLGLKYRTIPKDGQTLLTGFSAIVGQDWSKLEHDGVRVLTSARYAKSLLARQPYTQGSKQNVMEEWSNGTWTLLATKGCPATKLNIEMLNTVSMNSGREQPWIAEWFIKPILSSPIPIGLQSYWNDIIRYPVIPYDLNERKTKLAHAYEVLAPYMREENP
ncbi:MAG: molecular chaperone family-like protein, partial [Chthonomonadales bacterium]|nr:molecular chaperone family-like protein [Chthonomonadales bacterium]